MRILHRYPVLDTLDPMRAVPPPRVGEHRIFAGALHVFGDDLRWHLETRGMPPGVQREHLAY